MNSISFGSAINAYSYDPLLYSKSLVVLDPISGVGAIDVTDMVTHGDAIADFIQDSGVSGGQLLYGGLDSGDSLSFSSTQNATKGSIILGGIGDSVGFYGSFGTAVQSITPSALSATTGVAPVTYATSIQSVALSGYGFATEDEGNTVVTLVANLQAQLDSLRSCLTNIGLVV